MRHAARRNPRVTALGLELQEDVAELAAQNICQWGLSDRISVLRSDIREFDEKQAFDIVTLHNNIYYFSLEERTRLLRHVLGLLKPGGFLLLTTGCAQGNAIIQALNLLCVTTDGYDRLPGVHELEQQFREAGFAGVSSMRLIPGDSYYGFTGYRP
jgi:cyclopropane fatty-acyl-phospholipid synthase-like methyltransferase